MCQASRASPRECLCGHHQQSVRARGSLWHCAGLGFGVQLASQLQLGRGSRSRSETQEAERGPGEHLGQPRRGGMLSEPPVRGWEPLQGAHGESTWAAWVQLSLGCLRGAGSREALMLPWALAWCGWAPAARGARSPYPWAGAGLSLCSRAFFPG